MSRILFSYRGLDRQGAEARGTVEALDKNDALAKLRLLEAQGLRDLSIEKVEQRNGSPSPPGLAGRKEDGMGTVVMEAKGLNGQLELTDSVVRIRRKGVMALMLMGLKGDKEIMLRQISSIQFKKAGLTNGYIQFAFQGGQEAKGGVWQATSDENTVMFTAGQQSAFERIKAAIEQRLAAANGNGSSVSSLDELERLAALRDKRIITEQEFEAKKKQLLGL